MQNSNLFKNRLFRDFVDENIDKVKNQSFKTLKHYVKQLITHLTE